MTIKEAMKKRHMVRKYVDKKRYIIIGIVLCVQVGLFLLFKLYFFQKFTEAISGDEEAK